jgi:hypothetical protein
MLLSIVLLIQNCIVLERLYRWKRVTGLASSSKAPKWSKVTLKCRNDSKLPQDTVNASSHEVILSNFKIPLWPMWPRDARVTYKKGSDFKSLYLTFQQTTFLLWKFELPFWGCSEPYTRDKFLKKIWLRISDPTNHSRLISCGIEKCSIFTTKIGFNFFRKMKIENIGLTNQPQDWSSQFSSVSVHLFIEEKPFFGALRPSFQRI